jgi:hypothetical protein
MEVVKVQDEFYITILDKDQTYFIWCLFGVKGPEGMTPHKTYRDQRRPVKVIPGEYL